MNYKNYATYAPSGSQYPQYNPTPSSAGQSRITQFSSSLNCGDCLRGGWDYCIKSDIFGE
jgi:hypothetical protein